MVNYDKIVCPYCFKEFSHEAFAFRSDVYFTDESDMEYSDINISLKERNKYLIGQSGEYKKFWATYGGNTTEFASDSSANGESAVPPYDLPVIRQEDIKEYIYDRDGFVVSATDKFGNKLGINHKVCPHCHNPIPSQYGKFPVKRISIIGIRGSGKTVYISQLLKDLGRYVAKVGLSAVALSAHERVFIDNNIVKRDVSLPDGTLPETLCQPMFYDIAKPNEDGTRECYTVILYDIAGENCEKGSNMIKFSQFVEHSDGLILLLDPKQLGIGNCEGETTFDASKVVETLHNVFANGNDKCKTPIAVCLSKSDIYWDVLPDMARDDVQSTGIGRTGIDKQEFNASDFNRLSQEIHRTLITNASDLTKTLFSHFWFYNYFCLCAIGCKVDDETKSPVEDPYPKRIEEPMFWLFKFFGFIGSNEPVKVPNPIFVKETVQKTVGKIFKKKIEVVEERTIDTEAALAQHVAKDFSD